MMEKRYYFKTSPNSIDEECSEICNVKKDGTRIGSYACLKCPHNIGHNAKDGNLTWICCSRIEEATSFDKNVKESLMMDAWKFCDETDKSTEFMLQYMQDVSGADLDEVIEFLRSHGVDGGD